MITLTLRQPGEPDRRIEVHADSALLGRHESCDVVLSEGYISNQHLRIMQGVVVLDQKSRNGTYLDGQRVEHPTLLQPGDVLTLGKEQMTLSVQGLPEVHSGPDACAQGTGSTGVEESPEGEAPEALKLRTRLAEMEAQNASWRALELKRAERDAERAVQMRQQSEALLLKDEEIARLKARMAELNS